MTECVEAPRVQPRSPKPLRPPGTIQPTSYGDSSGRLYILAAVFAILSSVALIVDVHVTNFCRAGGLPSDVRKLIDLAETFGHGTGVALILITILVLDPVRRRSIWRLIACTFGAGLVTNGVKILVGRARPRDTQPETVWETFQGWLPAWTMGIERAWDSNLQSFPSGHTTIAVGLAVALSRLYPRGRWLFATLAALAAVQRIHCSAHYLSDTLAGAAVGCLVATVCFDRRWLGRSFDRIETALPQAQSAF